MIKEDRVIIGGIAYFVSAVSAGTGVAILYGEGWGLISFASIVMAASLFLLASVVVEAFK